MLVNFGKFANMEWVPNFSFLQAFSGDYGAADIGAYILTIFVAYAPVAFVVFAEHIADHKNLSTIIGTNLLEEPGLHRTLLGDGIGSVVGAIFGGCPNTTYGESVGCVAISGNASVITILTTAIMAIVASFIGPFVTFLATIPACVMGGGMYGIVRIYRSIRLKDDSTRRLRQQQKPFRCIRNFNRRYRRIADFLRTGYNHKGCLRIDLRYPYKRSLLYQMEKRS